MLARAVILSVLFCLANPGKGDADPAPRPKPVREPAARAQPVPDVMPVPTLTAACEAALKALDVEFRRREAIHGDGACGVEQPYDVRRLPGNVVLKPDTELTCDAALALARWVRNVVAPAARALGDNVRLSEITHASTYVCRRRNNLESGRVSEHALGQAIDINGFDLDGHGPIPVVPRAGSGSIEEAFQRTVRAGACLYFTTVLGPGSDDYHNDHLHLDIVKRNGGYRLCQ